MGIVTGGSRGIGRRCAERLTADAFAIVIGGVDVVVHPAGKQKLAPLADFDIAALDWVLVKF